MAYEPILDHTDHDGCRMVVEHSGHCGGMFMFALKDEVDAVEMMRDDAVALAHLILEKAGVG